MDDISKRDILSLLQTWRTFEEMWTTYWVKLFLLKDDQGWVVQFLHISGRYGVTPPLRPSMITRDSFHISSRPRDLREVYGLVQALLSETGEDVQGLGSVRFPPGGRMQISPWLWTHIGWPGKDVREDSPMAVLTAHWNSGERSALYADIKDSLDEDATGIGYSSFANLAGHLIGEEFHESTSPSLTVSLPLALHADDRDLARGKLRIQCRSPLQSSLITVFLTEDDRWSDDLRPLKIFDDGVDDGWSRLRVQFAPSELGQRSTVWVRYDGSPSVPRPLKIEVGRTERSLTKNIVQFLYGNRLSQALHGRDEELEIAVLNALASLGVSVFYSGVKGTQLEGADIIAVDHDDKRLAVIEVTAQSYRTALTDKRPVIVSATNKMRQLVPIDWNVHGVLALGTDGSKIDSVHRKSLSDANVVLMDRQDIIWLSSPEATGTDWWAMIAGRSRPWYFLGQ